MKYFFQFLLFFILFSFSNCDTNSAQEKTTKKQNVVKKKIKPKKIVEKEIEKSWDSLNNSNVESFLTEYGKQNPETRVVLKTKFGDIKIRLYKDVPIHRANFIFLSKINYFNTTVIYRVANNFVIQGGNSDNMYTQKQRRKYGNYLIKPEFRDHRKHKYGALAAARQWENNPNKLSSPFEFYIVHKRDGAHHLNNEHTVFGEVVSGFKVMDKIAKVDVGVDEWPIEDIPISIEVLD